MTLALAAVRGYCAAGDGVEARLPRGHAFLLRWCGPGRVQLGGLQGDEAEQVDDDEVAGPRGVVLVQASTSSSRSPSASACGPSLGAPRRRPAAPGRTATGLLLIAAAVVAHVAIAALGTAFDYRTCCSSRLRGS